MTHISQIQFATRVWAVLLAVLSLCSLSAIQIRKTKLLLKASKTVQLQAANFVLSESANPILIHTSSLCS